MWDGHLCLEWNELLNDKSFFSHRLNHNEMDVTSFTSALSDANTDQTNKLDKQFL